MKNYQERSLLDFQKEFSTEDACTTHLSRMRWPNGFVCHECGCDQVWYIKTRKVFDCKGCRKTTSLTAGTIFHDTRTPLLKWYWIIYHMAMNKVGVSIAEMQRILEIKRYETAWLIAHKIRQAMEDRDSRYSLVGLIEMDETFMGPTGTKQGRGSEHKKVVLCAVSLYRDQEGNEKPGFAHMRVADDASADTIEEFLERLGCGRTTDDGQYLLEAIRTDGWRSYETVARNQELVHYRVVLRNPRAAGRLLPWIHRVISNAKSVIRGAHHGVSKKHLQAYLSEFCYRFNRRFWERELFDRLVTACVFSETITYRRLTADDERRE